jgi:hypothetical protein
VGPRVGLETVVKRKIPSSSDGYKYSVQNLRINGHIQELQKLVRSSFSPKSHSQYKTCGGRILDFYR